MSKGTSATCRSRASRCIEIFNSQRTHRKVFRIGICLIMELAAS